MFYCYTSTITSTCLSDVAPYRNALLCDGVDGVDCVDSVDGDDGACVTL
jgi:hypothetical protein